MRKCLIWLIWSLLLVIPVSVCADAVQTGEQVESAEETENAAEAEFYGIIGKKMKVYARGSEKSAVIGTLEADTKVDVYKKMRTWTMIDYNGRTGYVLTKFVEKVQRKDPFAGPMPGVSRHIAVARVIRDTSFRPAGYKYPVEVSEGSWLSVKTIEDGRAYFPYRREEGLCSVKTEYLKLYDFVPWNEAQPGDLIYAFTTFYPTSEKRKGNTGRMYNIQLAADRITNILVPEGETFSFNAICGPYTKENGYREAPILSGESSMGYGGGVCQVCSTFYNIVLRVPMIIEEMNWHGQGGVSYLPAGFDATVGSARDLVVRNILPYTIRVEFENKNGIMTAFMFRANEE